MPTDRRVCTPPPRTTRHAPQVKTYARQYQFSEAEHDRAAERLARVERLMRSAGAAAGVGPVRSSEALLDLAADSAAKLEAYYQMEGGWVGGLSVGGWSIGSAEPVAEVVWLRVRDEVHV